LWVNVVRIYRLKWSIVRENSDFVFHGCRHVENVDLVALEPVAGLVDAIIVRGNDGTHGKRDMKKAACPFLWPASRSARFRHSGKAR